MNETENIKIHRYIRSINTDISIENLTDNNMSRSHAHNEYELYFLIEGNRRLLIKNNFYKMIKGDLLLIAPGILHKTLDDLPSAYKRLVINFDSGLLEAAIGKTSTYQNLLEKGAIIIRDDNVLKYACEAVSQLETVHSSSDMCPGNFEILTLSILYKLVHFLICGKNILPDTKVIEKKSELISDILNYINHHFTSPITLTELSSRFYMSEYHLCRCFKKSTGRTITEYINYLRIEKAKHLLFESEKTIKDIAKVCGFNTTAHFNHTFKEYENVSPSQYIKLRK